MKLYIIITNNIYKYHYQFEETFGFCEKEGKNFYERTYEKFFIIS